MTRGYKPYYQRRKLKCSGVHKGRHFFFLHYSKNINGLHYIEYGINRSIITCQLMIITLKTD